MCSREDQSNGPRNETITVRRSRFPIIIGATLVNLRESDGEKILKSNLVDKTVIAKYSFVRAFRSI